MIRAIIFDFDGVILESSDLKTSAFKKMFESKYPDRVTEIINYHKYNMGISRFVKFKYIFESILQIPYSDSVEKQLGNEFANLVFQEVLKAPFVPGVIDFLNNNQSRFDCFIASGTPTAELTEIVSRRKLGHYFKEVHGGENSKVLLIEQIRSRYAYKSHEVLFVGDAESDFEAAQNGKVKFVGRIHNGNLSRDKIKYSIEDITQLEKTICRIEEEI